VGPRGRRIAVLGDMLELGGEGERLHRELAAPLVEAGVDVVFCAGPLMHRLYDALPASRRGGWAETAAVLEGAVLDALQAGDAMMLKGSNASKLGPLVRALERRFPRQPAEGA
jgi:UDP-N-acetylmuramoyl-tripeptide--D-alanyl-D-alanine ligase